MRILIRVFAATAGLAAACSPPSPSQPTLGTPGGGLDLPEADNRIIFVGNSLTGENDLPGMVVTLAEALGHEVSTLVLLANDVSLEDHYGLGVTGVIRNLEPDFVVMQQGPSSLPESQIHLGIWADTLSRATVEAGGVPALFMVWPSLDRFFAFGDVLDAYAGAATRSGAAFIPAGEALRLLQERDPALTPFGFDGFHPNPRGSLLAALVITGTLFGDDVSILTSDLSAAAGGREISMSEREREVLPALAQEVVEALAVLPGER